MKTRRIVISVLLLLALGCVRAESATAKTAPGRFPAAFSSADAAARWAHAQFAGGRVDEVKAGPARHLVVFLHGSDVPVIRLGLYRRTLFRWKFVRDAPPPAAEFLRATAEGGNIILLGGQSGRTFPLP